MGVLAQVVNAATGTVVESFSVPGDPVPTFTINDVSLTEGNAGTKIFAFTVNLAGPNASESRVSYRHRGRHGHQPRDAVSERRGDHGQRQRRGHALPVHRERGAA